jgi:hypothetical protein
LNTIKYAHFLHVFIIWGNGYVTKLFIFSVPFNVFFIWVNGYVTKLFIFHSMSSFFGVMCMRQNIGWKNCSFLRIKLEFFWIIRRWWSLVTTWNQPLGWIVHFLFDVFRLNSQIGPLPYQYSKIIAEIIKF